MAKLNVFTNENSELVAIIKDAADETVLLHSTGAVEKIASKPYPTHVLKPASLIKGGEYDDGFIQAAIGGLKELPIATKNHYTYSGYLGEMTVTAAEGNRVKLAIGIPSEAYIHPESETYKDTKRNEGTTPQTPDFFGPASEQKVAGEADSDLIPLVGDEDQDYEQVPKLVLEWKNVKNVSVEELQAFFEEHQDDLGFGIPSVIKIDTGKDTIVKRQKGASITKEPKKACTTNDNILPHSILERTCKKCQAMYLLEMDRKTGVVKVACKACGYGYTYEQSAPIKFDTSLNTKK